MDPIGFVIGLLNGIIGNAIDSLIDFYISIYQTLINVGQGLLNYPIIKNGVSYVQTLAGYLLVLKLIFEAYQTYMLRQAGDPDANPTDILIKGAQSIAVITALPWIVKEIYSFGMMVSADIAGIGTGSTSADISASLNEYKDIVDKLAGLGVAAADILITVIVLLIGMIMMFVLNIQLAIRSAELALMTVIGPIMALNITTNNRSIWNQWIRQVIGICLTSALQTFMLMVSFMLISRMGLTAFSTLVVFIGWMYVTIKVPSFIKQFTSIPSTGLGSAVRQFTMLKLMKR